MHFHCFLITIFRTFIYYITIEYCFFPFLFNYFFLTVNSKVMDFPYPSPDRIAPCGYHIKGRKCDTSLKKIISRTPVFIRFAPKGYLTTEDTLLDMGYEFGKEGKAYGWNKDISHRIKQRRHPSKVEIETLVEFSPDPTSIYCNNSAPENLCEPVIWSVKVGKGLFVVRLYLGDPKESFKSDLQINKKIFTKGLIVEKNHLEIVENIVESNNGYLTIAAVCTENCENSLNKLSAIKISPFLYDNELNKPSEQTREKSTICGKAFKGGRCDTGPNVLHCIFNDPTVHSASFCSEDKILKAIPNNYSCKDQIGHYKCVNKIYINEDECKEYCPDKCHGERCF